MKSRGARLLGPLYRAVITNKPIPGQWRAPLVELLTLLMADPNPATSMRAVRVLIAMAGANQRLDPKILRTLGNPAELDPKGFV